MNERIKGDMKDRYMVLFSDALLHTKQRKDGKFAFKKLTKLNKASLAEMISTSSKFIT